MLCVRGGHKNKVMKIKGAVTFLINRENSEIEISDDSANVMFCKIKITPEQLSAMLSRQGYVKCDIEVAELEKVGKQHECKSYEFEITDIERGDEEKLWLAAIRSLGVDDLHDWMPDKYFRSQNTFFKKDGKEYARCTIRRWS